MTVHDLIVATALRDNGFAGAHTVDVVDAAFDDRAGIWLVTDSDGTVHHARVVVATNPPVGDDPTIAPYLGVASHGAPNYFAICGDDVEHRVRYVLACLTAMADEQASRIEVRRSAQRVFHQRGSVGSGGRFWTQMIRHVPSAFDIWSPADEPDDVYDGPAVVTADGTEIAVRARLTGHLEPIDGRFHWQGILSGELPDDVVKKRSVTVTIADHSASGRLGEPTPWGHSVAGVGAPPYPLSTEN